MASPGPADWDGTWWADLDSMYVTYDGQNLYIFVRLPLYNPSISTGTFGLVIATLQHTTTDSIPPADPWDCDIRFLYPTEIVPGDTANVFADVIIRGHIVGRDCCAVADNGWTELRILNGGNYDTVPNDDQSSGWDDGTLQKKLVPYNISVESVEPKSWSTLKALFK